LLDKLFKRKDELVLDQALPITINCQGGIGRTGVVAITELAKREIDRKKLQAKDGTEIKINIPELIYTVRQLYQGKTLVSNHEQLSQIYYMVGRYYQEQK
jgi:protein-tyrosine phosphatase